MDDGHFEHAQRSALPFVWLKQWSYLHTDSLLQKCTIAERVFVTLLWAEGVKHAHIRRRMLAQHGNEKSMKLDLLYSDKAQPHAAATTV